MKNKIAFKLTLYFSTALFLFSIIIGSLFIILFKNQTMQLHKTDLEKRAVTIADTLSEFISRTTSGMGMMGEKQGGYGAYLRFLDDIAMTDIWIVDENLSIITGGSRANQHYNYADLPPDAEIVVKKVFQGTNTFSEGFSPLLNTPTLTVGTSIQLDGEVVGALLLHAPVEGINEATGQGIRILIFSMLIALILSILLSIALAVTFAKPLKNMKSAAIQLAGGNYSAKTGVLQKDEIGELASAIDILSKRLDLASRESEQLLKLRHDFVANISHELRTPITVIRGSLEALCDEVITDSVEVKSYHQQMLIETLFLQRLVNDLLDLSRLQNIDFKMEFHELNLCDVLNDVIHSARHMALIKHIELNIKFDLSLCTVLGDYARLRQMFLIIIDNALKFSPEDSVITVSLKDRTVSIQDTGTGISQEDLPYIFDRFYKTQSEQNKDGTGLGLAIAKQIADRHDMSVSVISIPNEGTVFSFHFQSII
jgi:signal transduction histidine kinase